MINHAMNITNKTFREIITNIKKFKSEKGIEAKISYIYTVNNCNHSYHPIIAQGKNACTLHYIKNNDNLNKKNLILIDSGAEFNNYKTDITRTFPISGKFTKRQKEIYQAVLDVQKEAIKMLKPGLERIEFEKKTFYMIAEKLIQLKIITKEGFEKDKTIIRKYYPHSAGHFLGLDTHDLGDYNTKFQIGDVYTVEPGIYVNEENIGVRIEDNLLITSKGHLILSKKIPKEIKEIEELIK
jgi:Xaa-Pro aminopeptidase